MINQQMFAKMFLQPAYHLCRKRNLRKHIQHLLAVLQGLRECMAGAQLRFLFRPDQVVLSQGRARHLIGERRLADAFGACNQPAVMQPAAPSGSSTPTMIRLARLCSGRLSKGSDRGGRQR